MDKKNNHYIPRCLIKRWQLNNGKYNGVNVFNIKDKSIKFSSAKGKNAFSFASIENLYVLTNNDKRITKLEDWFGGLENSLSLFIDKVSKKESNLFKHYGHLNKLVMGLVSFEFRSRYFFEKGIEYLDNNPELKNDFDNKSSFQIILENVVNATTNYANQLFPVEFTVWESDSSLLLCDRPLLFELVDGYNFFPLTPNLLLSFKTTKGNTTIDYQIANSDLVAKFNKIIIENARDWIVSVNNTELEQIRTHNTFDKFNDKVKFDTTKTLINGYEY